MEEPTKLTLYLGKAEFFDLPNRHFDIWHCPFCNQQFYADAHNRGKKIKCLLCHKEVKLHPIDGFYDIPILKNRGEIIKIE